MLVNRYVMKGNPVKRAILKVVPKSIKEIRFEEVSKHIFISLIFSHMPIISEDKASLDVVTYKEQY